MVIICGVSDLLLYPSNARTQHFVAAYFLTAGGLGLFKGTRDVANFIAVFAGLLVYFTLSISNLAIFFIYLLIPALAFLFRTDLNPKIAYFFELPKRPVQSIVMSALVLGGLVAISLASILLPSYFYVRHEVSGFCFACPKAVAFGKMWMLGGVEEVSRVGLLVVTPRPVQSSLLWSLAHLHDAEYWGQAWDKSLCVKEDGCISDFEARKSFSVVANYSYAVGMLLMGLLLLWLTKKTRSVWPSLVAHILYNVLINLT